MVELFDVKREATAIMIFPSNSMIAAALLKKHTDDPSCVSEKNEVKYRYKRALIGNFNKGAVYTLLYATLI